MNRLLIFLVLLSLTILAIGTSILSKSPVFWLASQSVGYEIIRFILSGLLLIQLTSNAPRHLLFRIIAGVSAQMLCLFVMVQTYGAHMQFLDSLSFFAAGLTLMIAALEPRTKSSQLSAQDIKVN